MFKTPKVSDLVLVHFPAGEEAQAGLVVRVDDPSLEGSIRVAATDPETGVPAILEELAHRDASTRDADRPFWDVA